jgi:hypothetical protein
MRELITQKMKKHFTHSPIKNVIIGLLWLISAPIYSQEGYDFNLEQVVSFSKAYPTGTGVSLNGNTIVVSSKDQQTLMRLPGTVSNAPWNKYVWFYMEVEQNSASAGVLQFRFMTKKDRPAQLLLNIGLLPGVKTPVMFPLSYLDAQNIYLPKYPVQLKGTFSGKAVNPAVLEEVVVLMQPFDSRRFQHEIIVHKIKLLNQIPVIESNQATPIIDALGQLNTKDWDGKTTGELEMVNNLKQLHKAYYNPRPEPRFSQYGGFKRLKFKGTGFFHTHHDGKRWWLVDPDGQAFLSNGVDGIRDGSPGPVNGMQSFFSWLPKADDPKFGVCVSERNGVQMVDFVKANLIRAFGDEWRTRWEEMSFGLLKKHAFNTAGNWSDLEWAKKKKMPYVFPMKDFPKTEKLIFRDFPDVFNPEYRTKAVQFAKQLEENKDDPFMIGYFLDNEPHWAFGENNLAAEILADPTTSYTKKELINWIEKGFKADLNRLNERWKINVGSFKALETTAITNISDSARKDLWVFSKIMVEQYVKVVCEEVKKVDPNHLNLGLRYAWISSDLCYVAGQFFDVFSVNGYSDLPPLTTQIITQRTGKPVLIGEFHFGAIDRGLPATGIVGSASTLERALAIRQYVEAGFARPEIICIHYFIWNDQPYMGRFDGENYNIGMLDVCLRPYEDVWEQYKETNLSIYDIATKKLYPKKYNLRLMPAIFY